MAFKVAEGFVELQPKIDKGEFQRKVKETVRDSTKGVQPEADKTGSGIGTSFAAGFAGGLSADVIKSALGKVIGGASDLGETVSKTNVVFGKSSDSIHKWAQNADTSMGMSQQAAEANVGSLGLLFTQVGLNSAQAATMGKSWVQLAADLGSFNNADPTEILVAMQAATRGEYDSLQTFVPMINAAAVEQKAMAMTGAANNKQLNEQDKLLAINALMFEQTGKAQGDFARTSDSVANRMKAAQAQLDNFAAGLGQNLLPAVSEFIGTGMEMGRILSDLPVGAKIAGGAVIGITGALAVAGPLWDKVGEAIENVQTKWAGMSTFQRVATGAVGGVGVALTIGMGILAAYANEQQRTNARIQSFIDVLRDQKGAVNAVTRESAAKAMEETYSSSTKAADAIRGLNLDLQDVADAYIRGESATEFFNANNITAEGMANKLGISYRQAAYRVAILADFLNEGAAAHDKYAAEQGLTNEVLGEGEVKSRNLADAKAKQAEKEALAAQKAKEEADALQELINKLTTLGRLTLTESEAQLSFEDAIDKATAAFKDNGKTLDENTEKGRNNRRALNEIVDSTLRWVESGARAKLSQAQLNERLNAGAVAYANQASKLGVSQREIDKYTQKVFGVPASKLTRLNADKRDADAKIKDLQAKLKRTESKTTRAKIDADIRAAQKKRRQIQAEIDALRDRNILINIYRKTYYQEIYSSATTGTGRKGQGGRQSPGRASGGPVYAGMLYSVNERGVEEFQFEPAMNGTIVPHHRVANPVYASPTAAAGSGGGVVYTGDIHVTIPVRDVLEFKQVTDLLSTITQQARAQKPFVNRRQTGRG
jgi:hypothetical protein